MANLLSIRANLINAIRLNRPINKYKDDFISHAANKLKELYMPSIEITPSLTDIQKCLRKAGFPERDFCPWPDRGWDVLHVRHNGYSFLFYKRAKKLCFHIGNALSITDPFWGSYSISHIPDFIKQVSEKLNENAWDADWEQFVKRAQKSVRKTQLVKNSIEGMIHQKMIGTGIPYYCTTQKQRVKVSFLIGKKEFSMVIYYSKFMEDIDKIISYAVTLNKLVEQMGQPLMVHGPRMPGTYVIAEEDDIEPEE